VEFSDSRPVQWLEVEAAALRHNLALFRGLLSQQTELLAVVKANAYGHGLAEVAPLAREVADWLGVHGAGEARHLRRLGIRGPILVMGFVPPSQLYGLDRDVHLLVSSREALDWLGSYRDRSGVSLPVHLKIDIGTKRQGLAIEALPEAIADARRLRLDVVGLAGHYANIEDTIEHEFARQQMALFERATEIANRELGRKAPHIHASCSAAALLFRATDFTLARVGISMYGHWPSRETRLSWALEHQPSALELRPVLTWKALVGQMQSVKSGESVGYGRSWTAGRQSQLAVIPVGYADGYSRALGNRSRVAIRGRYAPVVGRVCMNILMADVTDIRDVRIGDEALLLGGAGESAVQAEELAELSGTINYEFLARLAPTIPRLVV
jgi:alanine racemase